MRKEYCNYRKIQKINPGAYIFQRTILLAYFWHGLSSEGLTYGGKFAFKTRLGLCLERNLCQ